MFAEPDRFDIRRVNASEQVGGSDGSAGVVMGVMDSPCLVGAWKSPHTHCPLTRLWLASQVAYGFGPHECIAMPLALVELQCALGGLFARLPGLRLAVPPSQLQFTDPEADVGLVRAAWAGRAATVH